MSLKDRMASLVNDVHDLIRDLGEAGGYYALAHDILQIAETHVRHASQAAGAAEVIEFYKGRKACGYPSCTSDYVYDNGFCFRHVTHKTRSCGVGCSGVSGHPGACDDKTAPETPANAASRTPVEERVARLQAGRCPECGAGPEGTHHYADCPRKE